MRGGSNLAFRWLCLPWSGAVAEWLTEGPLFADDASLIAGGANKQRSVAGSDDVDLGRDAPICPGISRRCLGRGGRDAAVQWTSAHKGHVFFAYADNYLINPKAAIILDIEATARDPDCHRSEATHELDFAGGSMMTRMALRLQAGFTLGFWPDEYAQDQYGFAVYINCLHRWSAVADGLRADQSDPVSHSKRWRRTLVLEPPYRSQST